MAPSSVELEEERSYLGLFWYGKWGSGLGCLKCIIHYSTKMTMFIVFYLKIYTGLSINPTARHDRCRCSEH